VTASSRYYAVLGLFLVVVLGVGFSIGLTIRPGAWYEALMKPSFTPPNWLFGPAWSLIYVLIAVAGWRVATSEGLQSRAFGLWVVQMILNWAWTPVFFGAHQIGIGLVVIVALLIMAIAFIILARDRVARWCFVPYAFWICYAAYLNAGILVLN
jgi:tryptophan-rich sensory protein